MGGDDPEVNMECYILNAAGEQVVEWKFKEAIEMEDEDEMLCKDMSGVDCNIGDLEPDDRLVCKLIDEDTTGDDILVSPEECILGVGDFDNKQKQARCDGTGDLSDDPEDKVVETLNRDYAT